MMETLGIKNWAKSENLCHYFAATEIRILLPPERWAKKNVYTPKTN
jgi:hypothetical protein